MKESRRRHSRRNSGRRTWPLVIGIALVIIAGAGVAYPLFWNARSAAGARKLIAQQVSRINATQRKNLASNGTTATCAPRLGPGILEIPSLGLTAPVEQGLSSATLDIAVGHDPGTGWPGPGSTGLLAAHDVSFFSQINLLKPGDVVNYVVPCGTLNFKVVDSIVTHPGQALPSPATGGVLLDTCWPPNALFFTPDRYVVTAEYVGTSSPAKVTTLNTGPITIPNYNLNIPSALSAQGLTLTTNTQLMGTMSYSSSTSTSFKQSPAALQFAGDGLQLWFALLHSIAQNRTDWISNFAPQVSLPSGLIGLSLHSTQPLEVYEAIQGRTPSSLTMTTTLNGNKQISVTATVSGGNLQITSIAVE